MVGAAGRQQNEQQHKGGGKGRAPRGSFGVGGSTGRELARRAGKASAAKRVGPRERAEGAFAGTLAKMVGELGRLWRQRVRSRRGDLDVKPLTDDEEYRVWWLADRIITATKGVIPISATVDDRRDIPIIHPAVVQLLRGIVPGREALELGEVVEAQATELPAGRPLTPKQETKQERRERNRREWRQQQEERERARRERKKAESSEQGDTPAPPTNVDPAAQAPPSPTSHDLPADPAPPTRPAPDQGDP